MGTLEQHQVREKRERGDRREKIEVEREKR
jgi:hypothetical protein